MTLANVVSMLDETGLPVAYDHYEAEDAPAPPYIAVMISGTDNFFSDNKVSKMFADFEIELCTGKKNPVIEKQLTDVLDGHDIAWQKTDEGYVESDGLFSVYYRFKEVYEYGE